MESDRSAETSFSPSILSRPSRSSSPRTRWPPEADDDAAGERVHDDVPSPRLSGMPGAYVDDDDDDNDEDNEDFTDADYDDNGDDDDDFVDGQDDLDADDLNHEDVDPTTHIMGLLAGNDRAGLMTDRHLMVLLRHHSLSRIFFNTGHEQHHFLADRNLASNTSNKFPQVPSLEGVHLMQCGQFGAPRDHVRFRKRLARRLLERELGTGNLGQRKRNNDMMAQVIHYDDPVYSGQFSDDGNFFFSCCQDFKVRLYDTSNPYHWKHYKTVLYPWGQWTLTDASLSPDNRWLAYTSIQSIVSIAPTDPMDEGDPYTLDLDTGENTPSNQDWVVNRSFGIWSIRFSGDGRELIAGTSADSIVIYDIESRRVLHNVIGHDGHVNAVCFADKSSPHILFSGSDDTIIKVWDRRSMGTGREAGAFVGHLEGLTYIDSKNDGRYILSNGKDQSMKLWDLRMAKSSAQFHEEAPGRMHVGVNFDYRREEYDESWWMPHPHDNSVVTFRGHSVFRTLIRCHFSPSSPTDSRYVYSGSADGNVYIWNLDATLERKINVKEATYGTRARDDHNRRWLYEPGAWKTCVRDASWHPSAPVLVASAWNGYSMSRGTCTIHAFNEAKDDEGEPPLRHCVDYNLRTNTAL